MINGGIINTVAAAAEDCTTNNSSFPTSNLAYYKLDGDATDSAGTNNGTDSNVTWGVGKFGPAAVFNGTSSKIVTGVNLTLQSACSLSVWVYFTGSNFFPIFGGNNTISGSTTINRHFTSLNAGASRFDYINKAGAFFRSTNISLFNSNAWNHIVITDDFTNNSTSSKLYVNGTQDTNFVRIITGYGGAVNTNLYIGQSRINSNNQQYLTGTLDQVRIFNTVITQAQVTELFEDEIECCTTDEVNYPVTNTAYYKLDGDATDSSGNGYNGTALNGVTWGAGKFDDAAVFDGSNDYINLGNSLTSALTNSFTVSLWLKIDTNPSVNTCPFSFQRTIWFDMFVPSNNILNVRLLNSSVGSSAVSILNPLVNGTWNNVVFVADKTNSIVKLYLNNQLQGSASWNGTKYNRVQKNVIGAYGTATTAWFPGSVDQVRIFNTAITAGQVAELYQEKQCGPIAPVPTENFNTVLYTGNSTNDQSVTGVGFQPDFVWIKSRNTGTGTTYHGLWDSVRGTGGQLYSSLTNPETNTPNRLYSFDSDGFSLGNGSDPEYIGNRNYVAWNWKAAGYSNTFNVLEGGVTDTGSTASSVGITAGSNTNGWGVSANRDAGFSVVKYTANATSGATIGHGLSQELDLLIVKSTNLGQAWNVYVKDVTNTSSKYLRLNETSSIADLTTVNPRFIPNNFTDSVFSVGNDNSTNGISGTDTYIAYCFHSVDSYSKVGSYTGNGGAKSITGLGFTPRFVMFKCSSTTGSWIILDSTRGSSVYLVPNSTANEAGTWFNFTFDADGWSVSTNNNNVNGINQTYIYLAIA